MFENKDVTKKNINFKLDFLRKFIILPLFLSYIMTIFMVVWILDFYFLVQVEMLR